MKEYDLAIIGGGTAGISAAYMGKRFSKKIVLIEKNKCGLGYIPSKVLVNISNKIYNAKKIDENFQVASEKVLKMVRETGNNLSNSNTYEDLNKNGVHCIFGQAKFIDRNTIEINGETIKAKKTIIATGALPAIPDIKGIDTVKYLTYESIFCTDKLPDSMIVLGAGTKGIEISQALSKIGIKITLVEAKKSILYGEEPEIIKLIHDELIQKGIDVCISSKAIEVLERDNKIILKVNTKNGQEEITSEGLLVCAGKKPNIEGLNLFEACVHLDKNGIKVNNHLETSAKVIYAAGDVIGKGEYVHVVSLDGEIAAENALSIISKRTKYYNLPYCIFSEPEIAKIGLSEKDAEELYKGKIKVYMENYEELTRAKMDDNISGLVKIICDSNDLILGASVYGSGAGEIINQIEAFKNSNIKMSKLFKKIHPYNTYSEILSKISKKAYKGRK